MKLHMAITMHYSVCGQIIKHFIRTPNRLLVVTTIECKNLMPSIVNIKYISWNNLEKLGEFTRHKPCA